MKDRILEGFVKDFANEHSLLHLKEESLFEHLVNFCILSQTVPTEFDFDDIWTGENGEIGLDGIAVIVNEHIVLSTTDVDFFKKHLNRLEVEFVFIQSKTSDKFDLGGMGKFLFGVKNFFKQDLAVGFNEQIKHLHEIKEHIYDSSIDMEKNPICRLYYVTTGEWHDDPSLKEFMKTAEDELLATKLFSRMEFIPVDCDGLKHIYASLRKKIIRKITFEKHAILPTMDSVHTAYIGILPSSEYLKLICDDNGNLQQRLFFDNVRDFLGNNLVNQEIAHSIQDPEARNQFALLNNGVTIVAQSVNQTGATFTIRDYQIVNGCQTSHVLYNNRSRMDKDLFVPVKLIVTDDPELTNKIIEATNSQTEIKKEAFESLSPFHKSLEQFYQSWDEERGCPEFR